MGLLDGNNKWESLYLRSSLSRARLYARAIIFYHVVGAGLTADIDSSLLAADAPKLVILGALPAEEAPTAANCIRELWPETKIVLLFERASSTDFQNLSVSEIDGCIPLSVSTDVLIGTLQRILDGDLKSCSKRLHPVR